MKSKLYCYYVSYRYVARDGSDGWGNIVVELVEPLTTGKRVNTVREYIKNDFGHTEVIIVFYSQLEKPQ